MICHLYPGDGLVMTIKTHSYDMASWHDMNDTAILIIRNPFKALIGIYLISILSILMVFWPQVRSKG